MTRNNAEKNCPQQRDWCNSPICTKVHWETTPTARPLGGIWRKANYQESD